MGSLNQGPDAHAQSNRPRILRQHEACPRQACHSASRAQELLAEIGDFSPDETGMIADAIRAHSATDRVDGSLAVRCWPGRRIILCLTEIIGEISNVQTGTISGTAFNSVWISYGTNANLAALSGYRWEK